MYEVCLVVLCGLPASGKTQLSRQLKHAGHLSERYGWLVIEYDQLLPPVVEKFLIDEDSSADSSDSSWKQYRTDILECVNQLLSALVACKSELFLPNTIPSITSDLWETFKQMMMAQIHMLQQQNMDRLCVLIDDNMYYRSMRHSYYQLARKYTVSFCQAYMETDLKTALERNAGRKVKVSNDVITTMATKIQKPAPDRNTWEKHSAIIDSELSESTVLFDLIKRSFQEPVQPVEEIDYEAQNQSKVICSESFIHQSDQILRKLISQEMAKAKANGMCKEDMSTFAAALQIQRKECLESLKSGSLCVTKVLNTMATDLSKHSDNELLQFIQPYFSHKIKASIPS